MNDFIMPPFPELEMKLIKQQAMKFNNWDILQMEQEDFEQEVLEVIIREKEKWDELREESNSEYLLKKCIQNYSYKTHINLLRNKLNYPHEVLNMLIKNQLSKKYGKCFDYFKELEEIEQRYFLECYTVKQDKTKQQSAKDLNITNSRMTSIELKMKQIARVEQYNMDFNIYINGGDIHGK